MNDIINIKERFKVDDSHSKIRGFVCAYDENNNLVFAKENMIVESGRRFILNNGIKEDSLKYVFLSENGDPAGPKDKLSDLGTLIITNESLENNDNITILDGKNNINLKTDFEYLSFNSTNKIERSSETTDNKEIGEIEEKNYFSYSIDNGADKLIISCLICFNDKSSIAARSLGIVVEDFPLNDEGTDYDKTKEKIDVLFSRVTFPTYYKSNHQRLTFRYYIYF